jgi:hypothetical protein
MKILWCSVKERVLAGLILFEGNNGRDDALVEF